MRVLHRFTLSFVLPMIVAVASAHAQGRATPSDSSRARRTPTQKDVARMLMSSDSAQQSEGLRMAQMVQPQYATKELRFGLVVALDREAAAYQQRLRNEPGNGRPVSRYHDVLLTTVIALKDSVTIPVLAHSLGTGMAPIRALAEFGPTGVSAALSVANAASSESEQVADGLLTLRLIVENSPRPLNEEKRARVHSATVTRLSGRQPLEVLLRAIDLAVVLGDADLRQTVGRLANSAREVRQRGVEDANAIAKAQQQARDRLAGVPAQPRR
jgi:hypothetical protein